MEESLFMDGVRSLFAALDRMTYLLITIFYNTITDLASAQFIKTEVINEITSRIYALLGVFMLFKISFSLINYIIDPDQISDKTKGGGALIKNIVITFALIVSTPFCFNLLYEAQSAILADQLIPRFILGIEINHSTDDIAGGGYKIKMTGCTNEITVQNMGNYIGLAIFKPFFIPEKSSNPNNTNVGDWYGDSSTIYCNAGSDYGEPSVRNLLKNSDLYNSPKGMSTSKDYTIDYSFFLSTAIGVVVALIMLSFCFDIATRTIKLLFMEIIAPIPIISYIDPNSSKNGMFIKWFKEVIGTWISLFTRLISLFLAVFVIQQITATDGKLYFVTGYEFNGSVAWIKILIIIGALIFAKQLPKLLENILGFKLGGNMTLNPFKKLEGEAMFGKTFGTAGKVASGLAVGAGLGVGASLGSGVANAFAAEKGNKFKSFTKGLGTGAFYGATDGYKAGYAGKKASLLGAIEHNSKNRNLSKDLVDKKVVSSGPFALPRYMAHNKYTDIIGKKGSTGTTDELKNMINDQMIKKQVSAAQQQTANVSLSNMQAKMSETVSKAINSQNVNDRNYDSLDSSGRPVWNSNPSSWQTAQQYIDSNPNEFTNKSLEDRNSFSSEYEAYLGAERSWRNAFGDSVAADKTITELQKQRDKVEGFKKQGK